MWLHKANNFSKLNEGSLSWLPVTSYRRTIFNPHSLEDIPKKCQPNCKGVRESRSPKFPRAQESR
jgi:hypothetical protein